MDNNLIFKWVKCKAYFKAVSDGAHIEVFNADGEPRERSSLLIEEGDIVTGVTRGNGGEAVIKDLSACDGEGITKHYFERVEKPFKGIIVGRTFITTSAELWTDTDCEYYCGEIRRIKKHPHMAEVYIVYYASGKRHYVFHKDVEEIIDGKIH